MGIERVESGWSRERINAFIKARLDDIQEMHEPYGHLIIEIRFEKGKVITVADERRMTHK